MINNCNFIIYQNLFFLSTKTIAISILNFFNSLQNLILGNIRIIIG